MYLELLLILCPSAEDELKWHHLCRLIWKLARGIRDGEDRHMIRRRLTRSSCLWKLGVQQWALLVAEIPIIYSILIKIIDSSVLPLEDPGRGKAAAKII